MKVSTKGHQNIDDMSSNAPKVGTYHAIINTVEEHNEKYEGKDFTVVAVHYPEFRYEEDIENVKEAAEELGVTYPIGIDNEGTTWRAYGQRYWPTRYVLDKKGHIRYMYIGEGAYDETEAVIRALMDEPDLLSS